MGQLCGKEASGFGAQKSHFETPGRTLASAAPQSGVSKVPAGVNIPASNKNGGSILGAGQGVVHGEQMGYGSMGTAGTAGAGTEEARKRAAEAAEVSAFSCVACVACVACDDACGV